MSSRNGYLSDSEKTQAANIYKILQQCKRDLIDTEETLETIRKKACVELEKGGFKLDYLNFADPDSLELAEDQTPIVVVLLAAFMGTTRLIDNMVVDRS